ncbi:AraC family transcriptional regulator [Puia sp.]|jgi:AraC-like DNA-binding protein|uniref:AraC family transcriptional regulator n=1 Tax=Puia sp. TaxID=2045100 RepID=UPI002F405D88
MINVYDFLQSQGEDYKKLSFRDLLFVHYQCPQEEKYSSLYTHLNFFIYVLQGKKTFCHPGRTYPLNEGTCAYIRKGGYLQEQFFDMDWRLMAFFVTDSYLWDFVTEYRSSLPIRPSTQPFDEQVIPLHLTELSRAFFDSMVPYFFQTPAVPEHLVEMKFREMIFQLLADPENHRLLSYLSEVDERQLNLREVMETNYRYNLSLAEFARIANRSLSAFKREFLAVYRVPPGKWLLTKRLDLAEMMLFRSNDPVAEIADECGFESQTHFNRVFKQRFGTAPLQYRAQKQLNPKEGPER